MASRGVACAAAGRVSRDQSVADPDRDLGEVEVDVEVDVVGRGVVEGCRDRAGVVQHDACPRDDRHLVVRPRRAHRVLGGGQAPRTQHDDHPVVAEVDRTTGDLVAQAARRRPRGLGRARRSDVGQMRRLRVVIEGDTGEVLGGARQIEGVADTGGVLRDGGRTVEQGQGQPGAPHGPGRHGGTRLECQREQQRLEPHEFRERGPRRLGA